VLSRIAESLYWMGRYTERAEDTARLLDVAQRATLEGVDLGGAAALAQVLGGPQVSGGRARLMAHYYLSDAPESIRSAVDRARENARTIRESVTAEMWEALNDWHFAVRSVRLRDLAGSGLPSHLAATRRHAYILHGATRGTMLRDEGFHWLSVGRHMERLMLTCRLLRAGDRKVAFTPNAPVNADQQYLAAVLLKLLSAFDPYRRAYRAMVQPPRVLGFLLFDRRFPRSAMSSALAIANDLHQVGMDAEAPAHQIAGRLAAELQYREIAEVLVEGVARFLDGILTRTEELHAELSEGAFARGDLAPSVKSVFFAAS
jgi:uncharacterized alpha-E superfamily protein